MKKTLVVLVFFICSAFLSQKEFFSTPEYWPKPTYDFSKNPFDANKVLLGRVLFYDPILSANNTISCESCHSPFSAFTHIDHSLSHGIHDSIGSRNSPALMNLAWKNSFMWDGAIKHLDMQALAPISHPSEMGSDINSSVIELNKSIKYRKLFYAAFGDSLATGEKTLKALSQFLLTLVSANSKYDQVKNGTQEFSAQEQNGYILFQKNCSSCHVEPLFTNDTFENNGLPVDSFLRDVGRMSISSNADDSLKFKVPTLRNIEYTYPYMHDGRFIKLSEVLNHYTKGIQNSKTLAPQLVKGIMLSADEKVDLISFLFTLSDKEFVFNPEHRYPKIN